LRPVGGQEMRKVLDIHQSTDFFFRVEGGREGEKGKARNECLGNSERDGKAV